MTPHLPGFEPCANELCKRAGIEAVGKIAGLFCVQCAIAVRDEMRLIGR